ncbi:hypothetical protein ACYCVF_33295 [Bradyrhizobium sp. 1.29L]
MLVLLASHCRPDVAVIHVFGFNVFSYELFAKGTVKETRETINQPVVIGGLPSSRATSSARMMTA